MRAGRIVMRARKFVCAMALFALAFLIGAGYFAIQGAGRCPDCNLPTVYTTDRRSHFCLACGRTFRLGEDGELKSRRNLFDPRNRPSPGVGWRRSQFQPAVMGLPLAAHGRPEIIM